MSIKERKISIIIPTLNEEGNIENLVRRLDKALSRSNIAYDLVFIDDHSADHTRNLIEKLSDQYPISFYLKKGKKGKGYAIVEGFQYVKSEIIGIIDADLQYPPEAIPEMIEKIESGEADFVIGDRDEKNISFLRRFFSKGFKLFFGRMLYGFRGDVQSGLKVFRTQIIREVEVNPSPWAWDLELMLGARDAGYKIDWVDILFAKRTSGRSTLNIIRATREIGWNAIKMKFRKNKNIIIPVSGDNMIGSGIAVKGKRFITHTTLPSNISAIKTFTLSQKVLLGLILFTILFGMVTNFTLTIVIILGILSSVYFIDIVFSLVIVLRSLNNSPEITFDKKGIAELEEKKLPVYSILCPLFKESRVLPGFIDAIDRIEWPKDKLDVMLLLEESDRETINVAKKMDLPDYVRIVIVPDSLPKTKPKACNYGLSLAKGDYLVIYDAEDIPEPLQLKKAYLAFQIVPDKVKCLQAKLNYFNPDQNNLTRLFTAEYSLWFDLTLPGLQSINTAIPLGGTSNHFRTKDIRYLKGWDPFNVTEDCDLGVRLFKLGYQTAIIDSVTLEEANSNVWNWIRQRSRWIKGYIQTYLVHMREPVKFLKRDWLHFFFFQMNIGGKIAFIVINPILWLMTIIYFAFRPIAGPIIESFYPNPILYIAVFSLVFGNFFYVYFYMIACAKRKQWSLIKYIFLVPFYWLLMSVAGVMAFYELIVRPHYWQKTNHGLNLEASKSEIESEKFVETKTAFVEKKKLSFVAYWINKINSDPTFYRGGALLVAIMVSNVFNFLFSAFLSRKLSLNDLGLVTLVNTLWYMASIFIGAISSTINHRTAYLSARGELKPSIHFWKTTLRLAIVISLSISVIWLALTPFLSKFFNIDGILTLLLFTPALTFGVIAAANRGLLQGNLLFQSTAIVFISESLTKLLFAVVFVYFGLHQWVFASITLSIISSAGIATLLTGRLTKKSEPSLIGEPSYEFPKFFYTASVISSISSAIFLSLDIILAKHYLGLSAAGEYSILALVGKMIYFLGSLPAMFMITLVSRAQSLNKDPKKILNIILGTTIAMVVIGFLTLGVFGSKIVPILLGAKALGIVTYLPAYTLAIALFTLANVIVTYHLGKKQYIFPAASLISSTLMAIGIILNHSHIGDFVFVILGSSIFSLSLMTIMNMFEYRVKFIGSNILDLFEAFSKKANIIWPTNGKRILIFNWRDTKHKFAGGAEIYIHEIAKQLVDQGNDVTLFCGNDGHSLRNETIDGINVIRRGGFYFVYAWAILYYFTQFRGNYDIIIDCHNGIPFFTPIYAKENIISVVHHIHQGVFKSYLPAPLASFACFLERDVMPVVYKNINFITVSESSKREMIEYGLVGKGIDIVHSGVDLVNYKPSKKSLNPMILYLGRLKAYKSIDVLVTSFKILLKKEPNASLVIAGSGEEDSHLKRLVNQLDIANRVTFTGKISDQDKISLLQKAWVMVNPSFMEGWGITTIEANACGTPVVAADVPGLRDSVKDLETGYLVPHGDSNGFAERILTIIQDGLLRSSLSEQSIKWAQNFSWIKSGRNFLSIIKNRASNIN